MASVQNRGPEPPRATSLCPGLPLAMLSTQGLRKGPEVTQVRLRAQQWPVATPTEFISSSSAMAPLKDPRPGVHRQVLERAGQLFLGHSLWKGQEGYGIRSVQHGLHAVPPPGFSRPTAVCTMCWRGQRRCPWGQLVLLFPIPSPRMCDTCQKGKGCLRPSRRSI